MKLGWLLGVLAAVVLHAAFLLLGGIFFPDPEQDTGALREVELVGEVEEEEKPKEDEKQPEEERETVEELESEEETPPDASEIVRSLELSPLAAAPALEAASLGAIEAALSGMAGSSELGQSFGFESGGRIGGTGSLTGVRADFEDAFSLAEMDQKPRAVFQTSPIYPSEMRGKQVEGLVTVQFVVDAEGKVQNAKVFEASHGAFEGPALAAVRKWKFEPGVRAGKRVATKMRVPIRFPKN